MYQVHQVGFPVFSAGFTPNKPKLLIGGGGGSNKSGIKNAIFLLELDEHAVEARKLFEHKLSNEEDGCMSLAINPKTKAFVAGINSSQDKISKGQNMNCRVFGLSKDEIHSKAAIQTVESRNGGDFQKTCCFSPEGSLLLTGSTDGKLMVIKYPELTASIPSIDHKNEVLDCDWDPNGTSFVSVSAKNCFVHNTKTGETLWSIENPMMHKTDPCEFRACAFGKDLSQGYLFLVINAKSRKRSFIAKWKIGTNGPDSWFLERSKVIAQKPVTAFAISHSGGYLAVGTADMSLTIFSSFTLRQVMKLNNIHGFPLTCITFSPSDKTVVTGSADGTFCVCRVSPSGGSFCFVWITLIFTGFVAFIVGLYVLGMPDEQDL